MGYTHYWRFTDNKAYSEEQSRACKLIRAVLDEYNDIICYECDKPDQPYEVTDTHIRFNGRGEDGHETFLMKFPDGDTRQPDAPCGFCKTARKPYDLPVCITLLALKAYLPNFEISSDGFCGELTEQLQEVTFDGNWDKAIAYLKDHGITFKGTITKTREPYCDLLPILVETTDKPETYEAKDPGLAVCRVCGHKDIELLTHIRSEHEMSPDDYACKYGDALISTHMQAFVTENNLRMIDDMLYIDRLVFNQTITQPLEVRDSVPAEDNNYHFSSEAEYIAGSLLNNDRMLLVGHTGCGKSSLIEQIAARLNHPMIRFNLHGETASSDFKGDLEFMSGTSQPNGEQFFALSEYAINDVEITHQLFCKLLPSVGNPKIELQVIMHTVRMFTEGGLVVDTVRLVQLLEQVKEELNTALVAAGVNEGDVSSDKTFAEILSKALAMTSRVVQTKPGKNGPIPAIAKDDTFMQELATDDDPVVAALARARLCKKSTDQLTSRLETLGRIAHSTNGYLPPHLVYYGAHTGRFSGGGGFNLQNLGRCGHGLKIRNLLIPKDGNCFIIADYAQIEARVLACLANQNDLVEAFSQGRDIYSEFATEVFGIEVRKPVASDMPEDAKRLGALRQVGKMAILGLGYGMGAKKFYDQLKSQAPLAPLFADGIITTRSCKQIVDKFRTCYRDISYYWAYLENQMRTVIRTGSSGRDFVWDKQTLLAKLPSGRSLRYELPKIEARSKAIPCFDDEGNDIVYTKENADTIVCTNGQEYYGGKLVENLTQAIARDILVEAILNLEAAGLPVAFHVHDEVIIEVPACDANAALEMVCEIMQQPPEWFPEIPLSVEAGIVMQYGK